MSFVDKFLDAIKLNDDYDDEDEFLDDDLEDYEEKKPKKRFFKKLEDDDLDDFDDADDDDYYSKPAPKKRPVEPKRPVTPKPTKRVASVAQPVSQAASNPKITPIKKKNGPVEMVVSKPTSMEDTRKIADALLDNCTVFLNVEGINVDLAQRIIDFSSGTCYSIDGSLQKVSGYIFILTPPSVEITGDTQDILNSAFDLPPIGISY